MFEACYLYPFHGYSMDGGWMMEKSFRQPLLSAICEGWDCCFELSFVRYLVSEISKLCGGVVGNEG